MVFVGRQPGFFTPSTRRYFDTSPTRERGKTSARMTGANRFAGGSRSFFVPRLRVGLVWIIRPSEAHSRVPEHSPAGSYHANYTGAATHYRHVTCGRIAGTAGA